MNKKKKKKMLGAKDRPSRGNFPPGDKPPLRRRSSGEGSPTCCPECGSRAFVSGKHLVTKIQSVSCAQCERDLTKTHMIQPGDPPLTEEDLRPLPFKIFYDDPDVIRMNITNDTLRVSRGDPNVIKVRSNGSFIVFEQEHAIEILPVFSEHLESNEYPTFTVHQDHDKWDSCCGHCVEFTREQILRLMPALRHLATTGKVNRDLI